MVEKLLSKPGICCQMRKLITKDSIQNAQAGLHQSSLLSARGTWGDTYSKDTTLSHRSGLPPPFLAHPRVQEHLIPAQGPDPL